MRSQRVSDGREHPNRSIICASEGKQDPPSASIQPTARFCRKPLTLQGRSLVQTMRCHVVLVEGLAEVRRVVLLEEVKRGEENGRLSMLAHSYVVVGLREATGSL